MPGNPYDGHTLAEALEQAAMLANDDQDRFIEHVGGIWTIPSGPMAASVIEAAHAEARI